VYTVLYIRVVVAIVSVSETNQLFSIQFKRGRRIGRRIGRIGRIGRTVDPETLEELKLNKNSLRFISKREIKQRTCVVNELVLRSFGEGRL
jgi:hypothetical protein